jgi:hypothetical protein
MLVSGCACVCVCWGGRVAASVGLRVPTGTRSVCVRAYMRACVPACVHLVRQHKVVDQQHGDGGGGDEEGEAPEGESKG